MALPPTSASSRPTVLVVDDSREVLDGLCNLLKADCSALFGFNGLEALALATSESPDLIVLDIAMPGMDGYEVLRRLKEEPATQAIPVIFLTAPGPGVSEARALELGAIDFITKPYDPAILKARIHNQLAYKRSLDRALALSLGDALTGIPNRRRFDEQLAQEWNRSLRNQTPLSMLLMDIDHFKRFNDALGHPAGDACLQRVAEALRQALKRSTDFVARYGGEEFACILAETDLTGAVDVAERIRAGVAAAAIRHPDSPVAPRVTLSIGVATLVPSPDDVPGDLTVEADRRLYEAKRLGRNRLHAEPVPEQPAAGIPARPSLLLVEDDPRERADLQMRLAGLDVELLAVGDGAEARANLRTRRPDLVLCAETLPDGTGEALAAWARSQPGLGSLPFILLTSPWGQTTGTALDVDDPIPAREEDAALRLRVRLHLELAAIPDAHCASPSGARFLVAAPAGPLRASLLEELSQVGIRATFAAQLQDVLPALHAEAPDALVLDLGLLDHAPAEALDRIRAVPGCSRLPILALATEDQGLLVDALESRLQDRLTLPFKPKEAHRRLSLLARLAHVRDRQEETRTRTGLG